MLLTIKIFAGYYEFGPHCCLAFIIPMSFLPGTALPFRNFLKIFFSVPSLSRIFSVFAPFSLLNQSPQDRSLFYFLLLILSFDARPICCYCVTGTWSALSINTQNRFRIHSRRVCNAWLFVDEISKPPIALDSDFDFDFDSVRWLLCQWFW